MRSAFVIILLLVFATSCTLQKRKYLPGWYHDRAAANTAVGEKIPAVSGKPRPSTLAFVKTYTDETVFPEVNADTGKRKEKRKKEKAKATGTDTAAPEMSVRTARKRLAARELEMHPAVKRIRNISTATIVLCSISYLFIIAIAPGLLFLLLDLLGLLSLVLLIPWTMKKVLKAGAEAKEEGRDMGLEEQLAIISRVKKRKKIILLLLGIFMLLFLLFIILLTV